MYYALSKIDITFTKGSIKLDGIFKWNDQHTVLTFAPKDLLDYGTTYIARVAADTARSLGGAALNKDAQTAFTTVGLPDIVNTNPGNNSATESYGNFNLQFAGPMKLDTMKDRITIDPKPNTATADEAFIDPNGVYYTSGFGLNPGTPYTVTIDVNGLTDSYGTPFSPNPQNKAYSIVGPGKLQIKFATSSLRPAVNLEFPGNPGMYSAYRPATQLFTSHVNVGSVDLALYSLPLIDFLKLTRRNSYGFQP